MRGGEAASSAAKLLVRPALPEDGAAWDAFVAAYPDGTHYHRYGWSRVIERAFGRKIHYRMAVADGDVAGVLPLVGFSNPIFGRFLVSVPFLNRGGVLATDAAAQAALVAEARSLLASTRSKFVELRHVRGIDPALPARETKVSMSIPLEPDVDELWKRVGAKVRNLVRKAEKAGLAVREGEPARDLPAFYEVFAENMRDLGTPVYTPRFFREVVREFGDSIRMSVVEDGSTVAAAGICVAHRGVTEIHWAASRKEYLKSAPNMLLYWDAISHAARAGLTEFCFGRSTVDSGPYRFKKQWGALPTPLRWEYLLADGQSMPGLNPDNPKFRAAVAMWRKLPVALTKVVGPPIVRHLP